MVRLLAVSVIISGLVATPVGMLQRKFRQGHKMAADQVTTWVSALTSIACALAGLGAMSLAIGQLAGSAAGAVLFIAFEPGAVRPGFDRARARALLRFGLPLAGSSIVVFAATNVDRLIVGALLGPVPLGSTCSPSTSPAGRSTIFSLPVRAWPRRAGPAAGRPAAMRAAFLSADAAAGRGDAAVCVAARRGRRADGPLRLRRGRAPAAGVLVWLALLGALRILFELVYDYFVVLANTRVVFTVQLVWLLALIPADLVGTSAAGVAGAGRGAVRGRLLVVLPIYLCELHRTGIGPAALGAPMLLPVAGAAAVAAAAALAVRTVDGDLAILAVSGLAGLAAIAWMGHRMRPALTALRDIEAPG